MHQKIDNEMDTFYRIYYCGAPCYEYVMLPDDGGCCPKCSRCGKDMSFIQEVGEVAGTSVTYKKPKAVISKKYIKD